MVDVRRDYPRIQSAGGEVVAITMGNVLQAAAFRERLRLPFPCLADPGRAAYQAYQVPLGGFTQIAGPRVWAAGMRALVRGGAGVPVGDVRQMQAVFLVDQTGVVRHAHRGQTTADVPSSDTLVQWLADAAS